MAYRTRERLVFTKTFTDLSQSCVVYQESGTDGPVTHPEDVTIATPLPKMDEAAVVRVEPGRASMPASQRLLVMNPLKV
jgi:hypothetical protein